LTIVASGFPARFPAELQQIARVRTQDGAGFRDRCFLEQPDAVFGGNCIEPGDKPLLFLWGDSTAAALYPGLRDAEARHDFRLARFSSPGCPPILDMQSNKRCDEVNSLAFHYLQAARPDIVLLHAMWGDYRNLDGLDSTVNRLKALKVPRIVIVGPVPVWKRTLPHAVINGYRFSHELPKRIAIGVDGPEADEKIRAFGSAQGVDYISARRALCDRDGCFTMAGDSAQVITTDNVHLSEAGSRFLVSAIAEELFVFPSRPSGTEATAPPKAR